MRPLHADGIVDPLGVVVLGLDVESKAADAAGLGCTLFYKLVHTRVKALSARLGANVDALYPPEPAVAPVAPFVRDHQAADDRAAVLRNDVEALLFVRKDCRDAAGYLFRIEPLALGLERHRLVKFDQRSGVEGVCDPYIHDEFLDERTTVL